MEYILYHHGVKGMKWGVRRYQNKDGSLTAAGKRKLAKQSDKRLVKKLNRARDTMIVSSTSYKSAMHYVNNNRAKSINTMNANIHKKHFDQASQKVQSIVSELDRRGVTLKEVESMRMYGDYEWLGTKYVIDDKPKRHVSESRKEERKLVKELQETYDKTDPDYDEAMALLKEIEDDLD